jgi:hypothetical protein
MVPFNMMCPYLKRENLETDMHTRILSSEDEDRGQKWALVAPTYNPSYLGG